MRDIEINIDELRLEGIPSADRYEFGDALKEELARLVRERGLPHLPENDSIALPGFGPIRTPAGLTPREAGAKAARAVYGNMRAMPASGPGRGF